MAKKKQTAEVVLVPPISIQTLKLTVRGTTPMIQHRWSEKAKKQMRDKQEGKAAAHKGRAKRGPKEREQEFIEATYMIDRKAKKPVYGFPAVAFKNAAITAVSGMAGITKVLTRQAFHIVGEGPDQLVRMKTKPPTTREDMVRVGMGSADLRYRPEFTEWEAVLEIRLNSDIFTPEQIVNMFQHAGFGVGVGEWRPEKNGMFGTFECV